MILRCLAIVLLSLLLVQPQAYARLAEYEKLDYETCRILVQQKEILSMQQLSERVTELRLGNMIDMMLLKTETEYIYEMEIAQRNGEIRFYYVDARTGRLLDNVVEEKNSFELPFFMQIDK